MRKFGLELFWLAAALSLVICAVWAVYPRQSSLTAFDADHVAEADTAMWRDYYQKRYVSLLLELYGLNREEFGFSPWDSLRIAYDAADAARRFQPTRSRLAAEAAKPALARYYALIAKAARAQFDPEQAADLELAWWQARRENAAPEAYGLTIARVSSLLYGFDDPRFGAAGVARAEAMAYRDARGDRMTDDDWRTIAERLKISYRTLKAAIEAH